MYARDRENNRKKTIVFELIQTVIAMIVAFILLWGLVSIFGVAKENTNPYPSISEYNLYMVISDFIEDL